MIDFSTCLCVRWTFSLRNALRIPFHFTAPYIFRLSSYCIPDPIPLVSSDFLHSLENSIHCIARYIIKPLLSMCSIQFQLCLQISISIGTISSSPFLACLRYNSNCVFRFSSQLEPAGENMLTKFTCRSRWHTF